MLRRQSTLPNIASSIASASAAVDPEKGGGDSNEMTTGKSKVTKSIATQKSRTRIRPRRNAATSRNNSSNVSFVRTEWSATARVVFISTILFIVLWLQQAYVNIRMLSTIDNSSSSSNNSKFRSIRSPTTTTTTDTDKIVFDSIEDNRDSDLTVTKQQQQQQQHKPISDPVVNSLDSVTTDSEREEEHSENDGSSIATTFSTDRPSFLIFQTGVLTSQGLGNIMSGMIAAVMLAEESNRTFCHFGYESFEHAFEFKDQHQKEICNEAIRNNIDNPQKHFVSMDNFGTSAFQSECQLKDMLSDHDKFQTIWFTGNTYPRWPPKYNSSDSRRDLFHERFQPTDEFLSMIPWPEGLENPPAVVVHLREPDKLSNDWFRPGLDDVTLDVLASDVFKKKVSGELFRLDGGDSERIDDPPIFLVTNSVGWYNRFPTWDHPTWENVQHSVNFLRQPHFGVHGAPSKNQNNSTSSNTDSKESGSTKNENSNDHRFDVKYQQGMQMWSDWYTLLNSKLIYHTHSDFSISAARWNQNILSWTILDSKVQPPSGGEETDGGVSIGSSANHDLSSTATLNLEPDFLEQEAATVPPLFERRDAEMPSTYSMDVNKSELKHCAVLEIVTTAKTNEDEGKSTDPKNSSNNNKKKPASYENGSGIDNEYYEQMKKDQLKNMVESRRVRLEQEGRQLIIPTPATPKS